TLVLDPAGPLYGNQNLLHPGQITTGAQILPISGEGILRPRRIVGIDSAGLPIYEYLPSTTVTTNNNRVAFGITVEVKEAPLTGQIPDQALNINSLFPQSIVTGVLPGIDSLPMFDYANIGTNTAARPVSSLAPAAYRTAGGNMILFHNSNAAIAGANKIGDARPGAPFNLFRSQLNWNAAQGTWQAAAIGAPIRGDQVFAQGNNAGSWFGSQTQLTVGNATNESNLSPFILHDPYIQNGLTNAEATLFMMNVIPTSSGDAQYTPYFAPLDATGNLPSGGFTSLLPRTGTNRLDPGLRRFSPRAAYVPTAEAAFVMYYGGTSGKNTILYVAAPANGNGGVTGAGEQEITLRLPASVTSASDPMPIVRQVRIAQNPQTNVWEYSAAANPQYVVDVHYTAVLRSGGSADICVSRYRIAGNGADARLQPIDMPAQTQEKLESVSRAPVYRSKHFGWYNRLDAPAFANAPLVEVVNSADGNVVYRTVAADWQLDNATRLLFQQLKNGAGVLVPNLLVYVDTSAGVVTFRGPNAPSKNTTNLTVRATYLPLAYRVAATEAVESSTFGFMDRRPVDTTLPLPVNGGVTNDFGNTIGWYSYGVQTRYNGWSTVGGEGIDRQWLYWQRAASPPIPASLFATTRRVGVDLRALGSLLPKESLKLSTTGGGPIGPPQVVVGLTDGTLISVQVNGVDIPFEVNYKEGRIYTQASYEGLIATVRTQKVLIENEVSTPGTPLTVQATLMPVDEIVGGNQSVGQAVPANRKVNENQPYAFLDLYDATDPGNPAASRVTPVVPGANDLYPEPAFDPALQPGKVWLFWSSSQGRSGLARIPDATYQSYFNIPVGEAITASGYDLFWQTLAPNFNKPSFSGFVAP
ncbi:MAG: hypothetical protein H8F28_20275, partial [Fibrella sp.]|nr:hypothetical protein [Armatimonadota bacterium]